jgi:quinohemoprotein amine dehydrogenase
MKPLVRALVFFALSASVAWAQAPPASQSPSRGGQATAEAENEGFPITNEIVKQKCGTCHKADDKGRLSRISFVRTTPEGWEETVKRMIALNGLNIEPADARAVVRYLADNQGLAPEEAIPAAFEVERRLIDYQYPDKDTEQTCSACHSMGRVISQRRTKNEWGLLVAMHRGYYPLVDSQVFIRRQTGSEAGNQSDTRARDNRQPMDKAIAQLSSAFPLMTPEWAAWAPTMRPPRLGGRWALKGYQQGKGPVFGEVIIRPAGDPQSAEFTTEATFTYARTGKQVTRQGRVLIYTGFQWRGRSMDPGAEPSATGAPDLSKPASEMPTDWREVMFVDRDWRHASGRWFTGAYDEFGIDVDLQRLEADPSLLGVAEPMIQAGTSGQEVHLFGANFPGTISPADINFGPGVTVDRVVSVTPDRLVVAISVARDATPGRRTVLLAGADGEAELAVYAKIDFIKVLPESGLARVGGVTVPKQFQQFEARAYANGPDAQPNTGDDIELGPVDVTWSVEEYTATFHDDDKDFVGTIDEVTGLFTPNVEGPNPKRQNGTDNFGDVWVVATLTRNPQGTAAEPLRARAHLLVSPPLYIRWYAPEPSR